MESVVQLLPPINITVIENVSSRHSVIEQSIRCKHLSTSSLYNRTVIQKRGSFGVVPRMARVLSVACSFLSVKLLGKVCGFLGKLKQHTDDCKRAGHKKVAPGNPPGVDGAARKRAKICLRLELSPASLSDFVSSAKDERITSTSVSADVGLRMLPCLWFD